MLEYWLWQRAPSNCKHMPFNDLWDRSKLEKWLYQLFMKTVLPINRPKRDFELIYSPMNATFYFRLLSILHSRGYPAHWLSTILSTILTNTVVTSARPPRSYPLKIKEAATDFALQKIDLEPFLAEFRTLTALWITELPFGIITPPNVLPSVSRIRQYALTFQQADLTHYSIHTDGRVPVFILVVWNQRVIPGDKAFAAQPGDLRSILLSDERGRKDEISIKLRKEGLVVLQTWSWDDKASSAKFWMVERVVQGWESRDEDWRAAIWRDDSYERVSKEIRVRDGPPRVVAGKMWAEPLRDGD
jgi:hypothetical protein